jgi:hypothetical protein
MILLTIYPAPPLLSVCKDREMLHHAGMSVVFVLLPENDSDQ